MIANLPKLARRGLALTLVFLLLGAGAWTVAVLAGGFLGRHAQIHEQRETLGRLRQIQGQLAEAAETNTRSDNTQPAIEYWPAGSDAALQASMQSALQGLTGMHGVRIRSFRPLARKAVGSIGLFGLSLDLDGDIAAVQRVIHAVESHRPPLLIQTASMRRGPAAQEPAGSGPSASAPLDVELEIFCPIEPSPGASLGHGASQQ